MFLSVTHKGWARFASTWIWIWNWWEPAVPELELVQPVPVPNPKIWDLVGPVPVPNPKIWDLVLAGYLFQFRPVPTKSDQFQFRPVPVPDPKTRDPSVPVPVPDPEKKTKKGEKTSQPVLGSWRFDAEERKETPGRCARGLNGVDGRQVGLEHDVEDPYHAALHAPT
ncbi:hypothetical protein LXL04_032844 [Taraxacum kok-saghyz]